MRTKRANIQYEPDRAIRVSARNFVPGEVESVPLYAAGCLADDLRARREGMEGTAPGMPTV